VTVSLLRIHHTKIVNTSASNCIAHLSLGDQGGGVDRVCLWWVVSSNEVHSHLHPRDHTVPHGLDRNRGLTITTWTQLLT